LNLFDYYKQYEALHQAAANTHGDRVIKHRLGRVEANAQK
jgi:hypothetical protein